MDFAWGHTPVIRQEFLKTMGVYDVSTQLYNMDYAPYLGYDALQSAILNFATNELGLPSYKYAVVFNGATSAIGAILSAYNTLKPINSIGIRSLYYPRFPHIIKLHLPHAEQIRLPNYFLDNNTNIIPDLDLIDTPSNPLGLINFPNNYKILVWDGAYYSPTYFAGTLDSIPFSLRCQFIDHNSPTIILSFGKLTGLNGLRIGFILYNDSSLSLPLLHFSQSTTLGPSALAQHVAQHYLLSSSEKWRLFFKRAAQRLYNNKEEIMRLQYLFGQQKIPEYGMFAFFEVDNRLLDLFNRAGVKFMDGQACGATISSIRINLARLNEDTKAMVDRIIKLDSLV